MALVLAEKYGGRCDRYCESFGQVCIKAAEEQEENCEVKYEVPCNQAITGTSDILCQCGKRNAPPQCPAPPATTQTTTPTPSPNKRIQVVGHKAAPILFYDMMMFYLIFSDLKVELYKSVCRT